MILFYVPSSFAGQSNFTKPEIVQKLYQILKDMHEVLTHHKIDYWIDGGTMLGAIRHKGLIPWDDDIDVSIEKKYEINLLKLIPVFYSLEYSIKKTSFGYKIFSLKVAQVPNQSWGYPSFDIFIVYKENDKFFYQTFHNDEPKRDGQINFIKFNEVYPLKEYMFGPLKVLGPNNPFAYLQTWYGKDWRTEGCVYQNHFDNTNKKKLLITLDEQTRKPALPNTILLNRFKKSI